MRIALTLLVLCVFYAGTASAQPYAYVTNYGSDNVSVIDISTNTVVATVPVGLEPSGVAASPDGKFVYVANHGANNVSIIQTSDNTVIDTVVVGGGPDGIAVGINDFVYVANSDSNNVSVIDTSTNKEVFTVDLGVSPAGIVVAQNDTGVFPYYNDQVFTTNPGSNSVSSFQFGSFTPPNLIESPGSESVGKMPVGIAVSQVNGSSYTVVANNGSDNVSIFSPSSGNTAVVVGKGPWGVAISPDGQYAYVTNSEANNVSVIDLSNFFPPVATVVVGGNPTGIAVTGDNQYVYVANSDSNNVSVIDTSTNKEVDVVGVGAYPANIVITLDTDLDGVSNGDDADDDNDGIPDNMESGTTQTNSLNSTRNEIPEGTDGDGIPNERDLDSDGDGIPDHIEAGGNNDKNSDGIADSFVDADGDGHHDAHDPSQGGTLLPLPDTDGDGIPDFLDRDSDNDGVSDSNETVGCLDADNDGILDNSEDANNDGLADSVHPETGQPCALLDTDGDGIFDHQDGEDNRRGSSSCAIASSTASDISFPVYLLTPAFILIARLWRRRTN